MKKGRAILLLICTCLVLAGCYHPRIGGSAPMTVCKVDDNPEVASFSYELTEEEKQIVVAILKKGRWEKGDCWCIGEAMIRIGDQSFMYSGTHIKSKDHIRELSEEEEKQLKEIICKYLDE